MQGRRTSPPDSRESLYDGGQDRPPVAGQEEADFIADLRDGVDDELYTEADEVERRNEEEAVAQIRQGTEPAPSAVPGVLQRVLKTAAADELLAVAKVLDPQAQEKGLTLLFHTPIGVVKAPVRWCNHRPSDIATCNGLLLMMVRSSDSTFAPNPGARLYISFEGHDSKLRVFCLAEPQRLYHGADIDLMCFLPETAGVMEKTGQLKEGAPSVVSGLPSSEVDPETGEPIAHGEKSASTKEVVVAGPYPGTSKQQTEDFDKARED